MILQVQLKCIDPSFGIKLAAFAFEAEILNRQCSVNA